MFQSGIASVLALFYARATSCADTSRCSYIFSSLQSLSPSHTSLLPFTIPIESFVVKPACCKRYYRRVTLPPWLGLNDTLNAHGLHRPILISDYTGDFSSLSRVDTKRNDGIEPLALKSNHLYLPPRQTDPFTWNLSSRTLNFAGRIVSILIRVQLTRSLEKKKQVRFIDNHYIRST